MKILKIFFTILMIILLHSCNSDDDICTSGEATPRLKMKFMNKSTGKLTTVDTLYVDVDYGTSVQNIIWQKVAADSVLIPLRVDDNLYTNFYVRTRKYGSKSKIIANYTTQSVYVSPACGIKRLYNNVTFSLVTPNPVIGLQAYQTPTQIINESKTQLYLLF